MTARHGAGRLVKVAAVFCIGAFLHDSASMQILRVDAPKNAQMHETTIKNIKKLMDEQGTNALQLTKSIRENAPGMEKLQPSTVTRFLNGPTLDVHYALLKAIADELGATVDGLTGAAELVTRDKKIQAVLQAMEKLEEPDKDVLVATSSSLVERYSKSVGSPPLTTEHPPKKTNRN